MIRLPVSQLDISLRQPAGAEDLWLFESSLDATRLAVELVSRLARTDRGEAVDAALLPITDFETVLLLLRESAFGDGIRSDVVCGAPACRSTFEVSFRISDFLDEHQSRMPASVEAGDTEGWFRLRGTDATFRLPCAGDVADLAGVAKPEVVLAGRCIRPAGIRVAVRRRVERAMEAMAPSLSGEVQAECPGCGAVMRIYFDVPQFVMRELRDQSAFIYRVIHLLASNYYWSEARILGLPRHRRMQYAEMLAQGGPA